MPGFPGIYRRRYSSCCICGSREAEIVGENTLPGQVEGCQMRFVGGKFGGNPGGNVFSGELIMHTTGFQRDFDTEI